MKLPKAIQRHWQKLKPVALNCRLYLLKMLGFPPSTSAPITETNRSYTKRGKTRERTGRVDALQLWATGHAGLQEAFERGVRQGHAAKQKRIKIGQGCHGGRASAQRIRLFVKAGLDPSLTPELQ